MFKINDNYLKLPGSYLFSTIAKKVDEYTKAHPEAKVIKMGIGDVTLPICQKAADAFAKAAMEQGKAATFHGYGPEQGYDFLRVAVQKYYASFQVEVAAEDIFISDGAKSDVGNILDLFDADNTVLIPDPVYPVYMDTNVMAGRKIVFMDANVENGFLPMPPKGQKADIIYLCSPNNPTGAVYTKEQLTELAELACKHDFYIISDEVYEKLIYEGKKHFCVASISEEVKDRTVVINGVSKAYSMTGWRVGYAAGNAALIKGMTSLQGHTTSNTCSIAQYAALEAISGPQDSVESMRVEFDKRRKFLVERLNSMDGITCNNADGAFYLMPNMTAFYDKEWNGKKIADSFGMADYLLAEAKIAVVPGGAFESPDNIRIAYSNSMESLIEGMNRMEAALKKLG